MHGTSDYDQRQYKQMLSALDAYERQEIALHMLVNKLEALLGVLQDTPVEWRDSFVSDWGVLEIAYAMGLERGTDQIRRRES